MKKLSLLILTAVLALPLASWAQTVTTPQQTFFTSVSQYFTSFDTNSITFAADKFDIWAGADTLNNQNMTASLGIEFLPFHSAASTTNRPFYADVSIESVTRNATVAGIVVSEQIGIGYNYTLYDTRVTGYVDGGRRFDTSQTFAAIGLRVKKALTENTYAGVGLELPFYFQKSGNLAPTLSVFTGFKF